MKGKRDPADTQFNSATAKTARLAQVCPPRLAHRLKETIRQGRRPCRPQACVKRQACPYGSQLPESLPDHCIALEAHLRGYQRTLQRTIGSPIDAHLLGIILRREELLALGAWYLSETSPFFSKDGELVTAPMLREYVRLLSAQSRDLLSLGARGFIRPDPASIFAQALNAAIEANPGPENGSVRPLDMSERDEDGDG